MLPAKLVLIQVSEAPLLGSGLLLLRRELRLESVHLCHPKGMTDDERGGVVLSRSVLSNSLWPHGLQPARLLCPWDSPGKNTGVGCHALLQQIFPTQGSNPGLPHYRQSLYHLSHQGNPRILEWVAYPFSRGTSQPKNWTRVSYCRRILYQLSYQWVSQTLQSPVEFYLGFLAHIVPNVLFRAWCRITTMVIGLA